VAAEIQIVVLEAVEVREQLVATQSGVGDDIVEVLHQRRLVQHGQGGELDRPPPIRSR
jgi:hypothetical protein